METYIVSATEPITGSVPEWNHTVVTTLTFGSVTAEAKRFRKDYKVVTIYKVTEVTGI